MKSRMVFIVISAGMLIAALFIALPQRHVSAQTCRDARGNEIPCPEEEKEKKRRTETPLPPTPTPTPRPTSTPTPPLAAIPLTGGGAGSNADSNPGEENGVIINWLLGGGLLLGLLIVGVVIIGGFQARKRLGNSGGEKGIIIDGSAPNPGEEKGALNAYNPPPDNDLGLISPPNPELGGPDTFEDQSIKQGPQPHLDNLDGSEKWSPADPGSGPDITPDEDGFHFDK